MEIMFVVDDICEVLVLALICSTRFTGWIVEINMSWQGGRFSLLPRVHWTVKGFLIRWYTQPRTADKVSRYRCIVYLQKIYVAWFFAPALHCSGVLMFPCRLCLLGHHHVISGPPNQRHWWFFQPMTSETLLDPSCISVNEEHQNHLEIEVFFNTLQTLLIIWHQTPSKFAGKNHQRSPWKWWPTRGVWRWPTGGLVPLRWTNNKSAPKIVPIPSMRLLYFI